MPGLASRQPRSQRSSAEQSALGIKVVAQERGEHQEGEGHLPMLAEVQCCLSQNVAGPGFVCIVPAATSGAAGLNFPLQSILIISYCRLSMQ